MSSISYRSFTEATTGQTIYVNPYAVRFIAPADHRRISVTKQVGLDPDVYGLYAFRHTSITRMLLAGTHTAIVAKCHDTSEAMIRKHYAASILDYTDEITRKTLPALGPALQPAASNVIPLAKR